MPVVQATLARSQKPIKTSIKPLSLMVSSLLAGVVVTGFSSNALAQDQGATTATESTTEAAQHQHQDTEVIVITSSPLARTALESAQPISVMAGDELRENQAHTLGDTLMHEPGINATHFAGVASSPIIRGLDGPRVKIAQNGLDSADVSRGSPDHAVTTETSVAEQVEIFRGPATLLYGSGAIGGVVNVVDQRIAQDFVGGSRGFYGVNLNTASNLRDATVGFNADHKNTVWHADAFIRRSDDYDVPSFTNDEGENLTRINNTFVDAEGVNLGVSYLFDQGYFGVSYGRLEQQYGIPGHDHAHQDDHADEHADEHEHEHEHEAEVHAEVGPFADLWQNRIQVHGGWLTPSLQGIEKVELRYGFTDYQHQEIEDQLPSTTFTNEQHELRLTANHEPLAGWQGAFGYHYFDQQQSAFGAEAYTPASTTERHGLFWLLEREINQVTWQTGVRYEDVSVNEYSFQPVSASLGLTYQLQPGVQLSANLSHAQRAPSANELFANGQHLATRTYELGLTYQLDAVSEHHLHIEPATKAPRKEQSNNIDLGLHLNLASFHLDWTMFYNRIDDYVFNAYSGFVSSDIAHHHEHDEHAEQPGEAHDHDHGGALPIVAYQQRDVELYGYELSSRWEVTEQVEFTAFSDYIRGRARDGGDNLPRIPAQRLGAEGRYQADQWEAKLGYTWYNSQTRITAYETTTPSYGLLNAQLNLFPVALQQHGITLYLKAENLTDELGFVHSSYLKDDAPIRGRNFSIGIRGEF